MPRSAASAFDEKFANMIKDNPEADPKEMKKEQHHKRNEAMDVAFQEAAGSLRKAREAKNVDGLWTAIAAAIDKVSLTMLA